MDPNRTNNGSPLTLMALPDELKMSVLRFLELGEVENLRRTCKYWRQFATVRLLKTVWGSDLFLTRCIQHCHVCRTHCPKDVTRIGTTELDAGFPFSSRCVTCAMQSKDGTVRIGHAVALGDFTKHWACRWCGWPILTDDVSTGHPQIHKKCYERYSLVVLAFFCLGCVQLTIGIVASGLVWHYYHDDAGIVASTSAGFLLSVVCVGFILFRGTRCRTYHFVLFIEMLITVSWIPCMWFAIADFIHSNPNISKKAAAAMVAFIALNLLFRVINIIGNIILMCDYDRTRHYVPRVPIWRRYMNSIISALIFWTYPQHIERKSAPDWA